MQRSFASHFFYRPHNSSRMITTFNSLAFLLLTHSVSANYWNYCCLCKFCFPPLSDRTHLLINDDGLTCETHSFNLSNNKLYPPNGNLQCDREVEEFQGKCCDPSVEVEDVEQREKPPTPAPTLFEKGNEPICPVCFGGESPAKWWIPTATLYIDPDGKFNCLELDEYGKSGNIPDRLCYAMQLERQDVCGCLPVAPTASPVVEAETPAPTPLPTKSPTPQPTLRPTPQPTPRPSPQPTPVPTPTPTSPPTNAPTPNPTPVPTPTPTSPPTDTPTPNPTPVPTPTPTSPPTDAPTLNPMSAPTSSPTKSPTDTDLDSEDNGDVIELPLIYDGGSGGFGGRRDIKGNYLDRKDRNRGNRRRLRKGSRL